MLTRDTPPDHAITLHIRLLLPDLHTSSRHLTDLPTLATLTHTQLYHNEELELNLFFFSTLTEKYYKVHSRLSHNNSWLICKYSSLTKGSWMIDLLTIHKEHFINIVGSLYLHPQLDEIFKLLSLYPNGQEMRPHLTQQITFAVPPPRIGVQLQLAKS